MAHEIDNLFDQVVVGFPHVVRDRASVHSLTQLVGLDHAVDSTDALSGMDLHLQGVADILPGLGDLSNLLSKWIKPNGFQKQLPVCVLGSVAPLLLHPHQSLGLVHHLKELFQQPLLARDLLLCSHGPVSSSDTGLNNVVEAARACSSPDALFARNRLPCLRCLADSAVERVMLEHTGQQTDLNLDRERSLGRTSCGLNFERCFRGLGLDFVLSIWVLVLLVVLWMVLMMLVLWLLRMRMRMGMRMRLWVGIASPLSLLLWSDRWSWGEYWKSFMWAGIWVGRALGDVTRLSRIGVAGIAHFLVRIYLRVGLHMLALCLRSWVVVMVVVVVVIGPRGCALDG